MQIISDVETRVLKHAIELQKTKVKSLRDNLDTSMDYQKLSTKKCKQQFQHYSKKLTFYKMQDRTKWTTWPKKNSTENFVSKNAKKRLKKNQKKIEEEARCLLQSREVISLVNVIIPPEAIVVLGKGLTFVETPSVNNELSRLDGRLTANKIAYASKKTEPLNSIDNGSNNTVSNNHTNLSHISTENYHKAKPTKDPIANLVIDNIEQNINCLKEEKPRKKKQNLSSIEQKGLNWLKKKTANMDIIVAEADKGGAKLIVTPELMDLKIKEKVTNPELFEELLNDPRPSLYNELIRIWKIGKANHFVTEQDAHNIVGITPKNNKSTSSHFKPGTPYFIPSLKIHKIENPDDLVPGVEPPARIITALQESVTKRSDIFLAENCLKKLEEDYCTDLVKDSTETLIWLDEIDKSTASSLKKYFKCFTFDFKSLYDSLSPNLVVEALMFAINVKRPDWKNDFVTWLVDLIKLSMESAIGIYKGKWYKPKEGIPTGGNISVQLANITTYYVLSKCLYSKPKMVHNITSLKRFIDDGAGIYKGSSRQFQSFKSDLTRALEEYNLIIEDNAWQYAECNNYVHFLDINFGFDQDGSLMTDLHRKETDSRSYLHFTSHHPNHVFSGIVYSQALRIRRIVNCDEKFKNHLNELKLSFFQAKYPKRMVNNIIEKVKSAPRILQKTNTEAENNPNKNKNKNSINVVSTFGADETICNIVQNTSKILEASKIFDKSEGGEVYRFIKRVAPSLKTYLCNSRFISLGTKFGKTCPCNRARCTTCPLMSNKNKVILNTKTFKSTRGNCCTRMVIYSNVCKFPACNTPYVGKTVQPLGDRICGHRSAFKKYCENSGKLDPDVDIDKYAIGIHLYREHNIHDPTVFNSMVDFTIVESCSPCNISVKEHIWIKKAKSL